MVKSALNLRGLWFLVFGVLGLLPSLLWAGVITGLVVGVSDGDTVKVLDTNHQLHTVRLMGIDAPEKAQPYGLRAKESLSDLVFRQKVDVEWEKKDKYGRIVGKVRSQDGADVCLKQLTRGMAWHYKRYKSEQPKEDQELYSQSESLAKSQSVGLWRDANPLPPWEWRMMK